MRLPWALGLALLLPGVAGGLGNAASARPLGVSASPLRPGVCQFGTRLACCYGWRRSSRGVCEAACEPGCKFGECVGPNKCRCFPGYTGKTCSQDVNECGVKPRPCQHRCVNTHGSYKCFCLSGHVLMPDASCATSRTCAMTNCQYGCEDTAEGPRCLCPSPGLRLAPGGRICIDVDECAARRAICPFNRRCVNTFGSYYCKCHVGFELKYVSGRYDCVDINECAANTHTCSLHANCLNTPGSFKCKCKQGYKGSGLWCSVIPEESVRKVLRAPGTIKDRIKKLLAHKNSLRRKGKIKTVVPDHPSAKASVSSDRKPTVGKHRSVERKKEALDEAERAQKALKSHAGREQRLRGDVFAPKEKEADDFDLVLVPKKAVTSKLERTDLNVSVDCSFDHGVCDWKQDSEDDFDWNPAGRDNAVGYYMAVPALPGRRKDVGRLQLLLHDLQPHRFFCLLFDYRLAGDKVGKLRVFVNNSSNALAWEETGREDESWKTGAIQFYHGTDTTKAVIFEAERGKGETGEIAVDGVLLASGWCPSGLASADG